MQNARRAVLPADTISKEPGSREPKRAAANSTIAPPSSVRSLVDGVSMTVGRGYSNRVQRTIGVHGGKLSRMLQRQGLFLFCVLVMTSDLRGASRPNAGGLLDTDATVTASNSQPGQPAVNMSVVLNSLGPGVTVSALTLEEDKQLRCQGQR